MRSRILLTISTLALALATLSPLSQAQYAVSTVAGGGPNSLAALSSSIGYPGSVAFDALGNTYIADSYSSHIFKVDTAGVLTVVAGNGTRGYSGDGGPATSAALAGPEGVFVDAAGDVYIADTENSVVRMVAASTGNITTVAGNALAGAGYSGDGSLATSAQLNDPFGICVDAAGNLFIADTDNFVIREVTAGSGNIQTVAGNNAAGAGYSGDGALATSAQLDLPEGVFVDAAGNIFIADAYNNLIRVVNPSTASVTIAAVTIGPGDIQTVVGMFYDSEGGTACAYAGTPGPALSAQLCVPSAVVVDSAEDIFVVDTENSVVREVAASGVNVIATVAGSGIAGFEGDTGAATAAELQYPSGMVLDGSGDMFIADTNNFAIREVTASTGDINTTVGNSFLAYSGDGGSALNAELNYPGSVFVDALGNIFIADSVNSVIREVSAGVIQTVAGNGTVCVSTLVAPSPVCGDGGPASAAQFNYPSSVFVDATGNIFIADTNDGRIRVVNTGAAPVTIANVVIAAGDVATVAGSLAQPGVPCQFSGDGAAATSAQLCSPAGVFVDSQENIFIADSVNQRIREVAASTGIITTAAGNGTQCTPSTAACGDGGAASGAQLSFPQAVFVDAAENIYIADTGDNRVRAVNPSSSPVTVAGVTIPAGDIVTLAGTGNPGYAGDDAVATSAQLTSPFSVFVDSTGNIFVADTGNSVMREVLSSSGFIATVAGNNTQGFAGDGGPSASAEFNVPLGVFGDVNSNLYVADTDSLRIRELAITITAPSAAAPAPQTTSAGGTANYSIKLNADSGNPKYPITLSCLESSLPTGASCSFSPAAITPGPLPVPFTLTITVASASASLERQAGTRRTSFVAFLSCMPIFGVLLMSVGARDKRNRWLMLAAACVFLVALSACGGGSSGSGSHNGTTYSVQVQGATTVQPAPVTITTATLTVQ